jgi:hypothetical protein
MMNLDLLNKYRVTTGPLITYTRGYIGDDTCGFFHVPSPIDHAEMMVMAASGLGWDHVSVSRKNRCPNWLELEYVYRMFFREDETAIEYHVPMGDHVNQHPYCLHLWRSLDHEMPRPPSIMIGFQKQL